MNKFFERVHNKIVIPISKRIYKHKKIERNKIVIDNFGGRGFGDNPKYIVEALLQKDRENLDIVWLVNDTKLEMPKGVRKVKYNSVASIKELSTAKIWIDNIKNATKPLKKKNQYYIQTWHGGIGLKAVERQVEDQLNSKYVKKAKKDAAQTDLMLSDSTWTTEIFKKWFWYDGIIKKTGFPRNDILVKNNESLRDKIYLYFNIDKQNKIILYAPTFRQSADFNTCKVDFKKILDAVNRKFAGEYVVLIRLHPNTFQQLSKENKKLYDFNKQIINASIYPDMQELLAVSDILITDYSSCMFDGMIGKKKVFLLMKDFHEYIAQERRLLFNIEKLPFKTAFSDNDLVNVINHFDNDAYFTDLNNFQNELDVYEMGTAGDKVADIVIKKIKEVNLE